MKKYFLGIAIAMFCTSLRAQVGIGTDTPKATLDISALNSTGNSTLVDGVLIPRIDRERAQNMLEVSPSTLVYIDDVTTGDQENQSKFIDSQGYYYFVLDPTDNQKGFWIKLGAEYAKPQFFYMPSVLLPTLTTDERLSISDSGYTYDASTKEFNVDLYSLFYQQFGTPVTSSDSNAKLTGFVLNSNQYDYFITYADETVFDLGNGSTIESSIILTEDGVLKYKILPDAVIRNGSFMNVVLKVK